MKGTVFLGLGLAILLGSTAAVAAPAGYVPPRIKQTPANRPDWTGIWHPAERNIFDPEAFTDPRNKGEVNDAAYIREFPPYNAEWEAKYLGKLADNKAGKPTDPTASCRPGGMPRIMTSPYPMEFMIQADLTVVLHELSSQVRRIFTDGRPHPAADDLDPTYMGHSIGYWEGDTLVVDTVGLVGHTVYDVTAAPHSDQLHLTERIRRISPTQMEDVITVTDPVAFTRPWTVHRHYDLKSDWQIREYVCEDNNRNPILPDGTTGLLLKAP